MAVANVACGRATGFSKEQAEQVPGLRVSPVGVVEEGKKVRFVYDLTSGQKDGNGGESANSTMDWEEIRACAVAEVMGEALQKVRGLRVKFGSRARILISKI